MKKICMIFVLGAFLVLLSLLGVAEETEKSKVKFSLNVGGLFAQVSQGYDLSFDFDSRDEEGTWTEAVENLGGKFGFDIGASIFPIPQLEIYASYNTYGGTTLGEYSLTVPDVWWDGETVSTSLGEVESEFKATVVNIGLAFHPEMSGKIKPYFGAGLSSITVKMDLLDSGSIDDLWDVDESFYWWDFYDYTYNFESVETIGITKVGFTEESETVWGFHAKAGINIEVTKNISIFVEGRYLSAKVEFDRPEIRFKTKVTLDYYYDYYDYYYNWGYSDEYTETWTEEEELEIDEQMEIKVGGIQGIVGIKFTF